MNILILTGRFGMGHYSAAEAVKQEILAGNGAAKVEIIDFIDYMVPALSKAVYGSFDFMVSKCAGVYNFLGSIASRYHNAPLEKTSLRKIQKLLSDYEPEMVIATLPICAQYISTYKKMKGSLIPLYTYITDIDIHEEWIAENTDMYFVGGAVTKKVLMEKGVEPEKIMVSGIPVRQVFKNNGKKPEDSLRGTDGMQYEDSNGETKRKLLIMGGGLGLIPLPKNWLRELSGHDDFDITLIAGKNKRMFRRISRDFPGIKVVGYTKNIHEYMARADLIVTKSGGITTFEAIQIETPLYVIRPFLMQEIGNAQYIEEFGIGKIAWDKGEGDPGDLLRLIQNKRQLADMRKNMRALKEEMISSSPLEIYERNGRAICC